MKNRKVKYIMGIGIIAAAFGYLLWSSFMGSFRYSMKPSEFIDKKEQYVGKYVKISGMVEEGSILVDGSEYRFVIKDDTSAVKVFYDGIVPNTFREGAEVIATGKYDPEKDMLIAKEIITKCASKYVK